MSITSPAEAASAGERKFAVLMFADLSGYTALCERLDAEDVVALIHPVMTSLHRAAEEAGGVICTTAGDGFFTVFGVPLAAEDPALQALRAAQQIRSLVDAAKQQPGANEFPGVHIGVAAGEVLVVPNSGQPGFSVVGSAVNLASRLCDAASTREILVDTACRTLTAQDVAWAEPRELHVRGLAEPTKAWTLPPETELGTTRARAAFVNRDDVLTRLDEALARVRDASNSEVIALCGDAGIGKSRAVEHWLEHRADVASLWFRCGDQYPVGDLLALMDVVAEASGQRLPPVLAHALQDDRPHKAGADSPVYTDPFPAVVVAARRLFESASGEGFALVLDDVHLADASLVALIDDLRAHPMPVMLLVIETWRTGEFDSSRPMEMMVPPLSDEHVEELLSSVVGGRVDSTVRRVLIDRLAGHPLMAEQSASYLLESGAIEVEDGLVRATAPDTLVTLPTSIRLFVSARIDRLPSEEKALLLMMSVLGAEFAESELRDLSGEAFTALPGLLERGLALRVGAGRLRFGHGLVQEIAYAALPRSQRSQLHRSALSLLHANADVARHALHAVAWAESTSSSDPGQRREAIGVALTESLKYGRRLMSTQTMSANEVLTRALRLVESDGDTAGPLVEVLTTTANCLIEMWRFGEAEQLATRAVSLCKHDDASRAALDARMALGAARSRQRRFQSARQVLEDVLTLAESAGDDVARGRALRHLGETWRQTSFATFLQLTEQSYEVLDRAGDIDAAADCARWLAYLTALAPSVRYRRWLQLAIERTATEDSRGQAMLARTNALAAVYRLDMRSARASALRAVEQAETAGALDALGDALSVLVDTSVAAGSVPDFDRYCADYAELAERTGNPRTWLFVRSCSALGLLRSGRLAECLEALAAARQDADGFGAGERAEIAGVSALVHRDRGDWQLALDDLEVALSASVQAPMDVETLLYRCHASRVVAASGGLLTKPASEELVRECEQAEAPFLASYAQAIAEHAAVVRGETLVPTKTAEGACIEEQGIRADTAALLAERSGDDPTEAWATAEQTWQQLGVTIWLARAQHRSGDTAAAAKTLDLLDASDEARAWIGQR